MSTPFTRKLAAIVSTDVVGYSRLVGADEAGTLARMKAHREELWNPEIEARGGRIVGTAGDSLLVEFASAVAAVECAIAVQQGMAQREADTPEETKMRLRIGVNIGEIVVDGEDILGDGVNVAARLEGAADAGGVAISAAVHEQVQGKIAETFIDAGELAFKNISRPIGVWRWNAEGAVAGGGYSRIGAGATSGTNSPTIAVMPFENRSSDPEQAYLAEGIGDDLIHALTRLRWLRVAPRHQSFRFDPNGTDLSQVMDELGVGYLVTGTVRKGGDRIRVTAQLHDASQSTQIWSDRFDRALTDLFELQDEIVETIARAIEPEITLAEREGALRKPPGSIGAWDAYQRGLWHLYRFTSDDNLKAQEWFERAIQLDGSFASAHAAVGYAHFLAAVMDYEKIDLDAGFAASRQAVDLDNMDAMGHFSLGRICMLLGRYDEALEELALASGLNPNSDSIHYGIAYTHILKGEFDEADHELELAANAHANSPLLWAIETLRGLVLLLREQDDEAVKVLRRAARRPHADFWPNVFLAAALSYSGELQEARRILGAQVATDSRLRSEVIERAFPFRNKAHADRLIGGLVKAGADLGT